MVNSIKKKNLSVITPSIKKSRANTFVSTEIKSYHIANPNPQNFNQRYKGVREIGY
jgi:hypothetical protein